MFNARRLQTFKSAAWQQVQPSQLTSVIRQPHSMFAKDAQLEWLISSLIQLHLVNFYRHSHQSVLLFYCRIWIITICHAYYVKTWALSMHTSRKNIFQLVLPQLRLRGVFLVRSGEMKKLACVMSCLRLVCLDQNIISLFVLCHYLR